MRLASCISATKFTKWMWRGRDLYNKGERENPVRNREIFFSARNGIFYDRAPPSLSPRVCGKVFFFLGDEVDADTHTPPQRLLCELTDGRRNLLLHLLVITYGPTDEKGRNDEEDDPSFASLCVRIG